MLSPVPERPYHHGNLRQSFMDAACDHLRESSAESLSLRGLARRIGVSQTAPYRHFKSKAALFAAIAEDGFDQLHSATYAAETKHADNFEVAFTEVGLAYVNWALANPEKYQLLFDSSTVEISQHPELLIASQRTFENLTRLIETGIASGFFVDRPVAELAGAMWVCVHGIASLLINKSKMLSLSGQEDNPVLQTVAALSNDPRVTIELLIQSIRC